MKQEGRKESAEVGFAMAEPVREKGSALQRVTENDSFCLSGILGCCRECPWGLCPPAHAGSVAVSEAPSTVCRADCCVQQCPWNSKGFVSVGCISSWSKCFLVYSDRYLNQQNTLPRSCRSVETQSLVRCICLGFGFGSRSTQLYLQKLCPHSVCYMLEK